MNHIGTFSMCIHRRGRKRGVVLIVAAVALVALLGLAALTVDIGRAALAAQRAQEVADAAALAAAQRMPEVNYANTALTNTLDANNAALNWPSVSVGSDDFHYYQPGTSVPDYGVLPAGQYAVTVEASVDDEFLLARAVGLNEMHIARKAIALAERRYDSLPVLFANQDVDWEDGFVSTGSGVYIDGAMHSNSGVIFRGSNITVTGLIEYRHYIILTGQDIDLQQGAVWGNIEPYPINHTWDDFLPWDTEVNGDWVITEAAREFGKVHVNGDLTISSKDFMASNGLIMVEGNVVFNGASPHLDNVTIVAKGTITFNGAAVTMTPYIDNLSLVSYAASDKAITFNGGGAATEGIIFAPYGTVTFHGADHSLHTGSIISLQIVMRGGQYNIKGTTDPTTGYMDVRLVK